MVSLEDIKSKAYRTEKICHCVIHEVSLESSGSLASNPISQSPAPCNTSPQQKEQFHYHVNLRWFLCSKPSKTENLQFLPGLTRLYTSLFSPAFHSTFSSSPLHSPCSSQTSLLTILGAHQHIPLETPY